MVKKIMLFAFAGALLSCSLKNRTAESQPEETAGCCTPASTTVDNHSANVSLDYQGTYTGVVLCDQCDSVDIKLTINEGNTFSQVVKCFKLGGGDLTFEGTFSWNEAGNTITLSGVENAPNKFFVGENQLFVLDENGERRTGETAGKYILRK